VNDVIYKTTLDGTNYRIRQLDANDCVVEMQGQQSGNWLACDAGESAEIYRRAFIKMRNGYAVLSKLIAETTEP
jgi:hypothetical protein